MATFVEAQGHTVDEAIQIALNQLGVTRDKVEIDILHHPRRGVLGIGARRAKVRATLRDSVMVDGEEFDMSGGSSLEEKPRRRRRRGGRGRGRDDGPEPQTQGQSPGQPQAQPQRSAPREQGRPDRDRDRRGGDRGRGGDRRQGDPQRAQPERAQDARGGAEARPQQRGQEEQRGQRDSRGQQQRGSRDRPQGGQQRDGRGRDRGRGRENGAGSQDAPREPRPPQPRSHGDESRAPREDAPRRQAIDEAPLDFAALDAIRVRAEELLRGVLGRMGFEAELSSAVDEAAGEVVLTVRSESEGLLIGRRGQTLDSLEHIVNRMALRGEAFVEGRVLVDIGDYRKRRSQTLEELAQRLRGRAVGEQRSVQVSPMSPRDRKLFLQVFAGDEAVEARTLGAGFYRRVVVAPAGMSHAAMADAETVSHSDDEDGGEDESTARPETAS